MKVRTKLTEKGSILWKFLSNKNMLKKNVDEEQSFQQLKADICE